MGPPAISSARLGTGPRAACKTMPCRLTKANPCFGLTVPPLTVCATNDHASSAGTQAPSGADTFVDQFGGSEPLRGSTGAMSAPAEAGIDANRAAVEECRGDRTSERPPRGLQQA